MRGEGRPLWDDLATLEDLAVLDPGRPEGWDQTPDVLVVGGGVVGLAAAAFCRRAGQSVLLVERERLAHAASGRAAGALTPDGHPEFGERWHALARSSLALHRELDAEWGYGLRPLDMLMSPDALFPGQAHVDPLGLAAALARRAGTVATGVECTYTLTAGDRVVTVNTTGGVVHPGNVVFATGACPPQAPEFRDTLVKGHLIATEPCPPMLSELLVDGEILVVQLADGRFVAGGTKDVDDGSEAVDERVVSSIESKLAELVPRAAGARRTHAWCCFRPCSRDRLPLIDQAPGLSNAWVASGFYSTGILMAPVAGRLLSEWISSGRPEGLGPFSGDRLLSPEDGSV